jgi:hypothetical protein
MYILYAVPRYRLPEGALAASWPPSRLGQGVVPVRTKPVTQSTGFNEVIVRAVKETALCGRSLLFYKLTELQMARGSSPYLTGEGFGAF